MAKQITLPGKLELTKLRKLELEQSAIKFEVLTNEQLLSMRKDLEALNRLSLSLETVFQNKLDKLEQMQAEHEIKHTMFRPEFENHLKGLDKIEQGRSPLGITVKKKLKLIKEFKERENKQLLH
ncbi:hypothetical protein FJZ53_00145 [Candidatus Woesearchaeota archaeon]|nr:hypothetical protein [Candidatus Woesearchaeota archaeon]